MKFCLSIIALAGAPAAAVAQDAVTASAAQVVDISADRNARMTVPVIIEGKGPYRFVVDTGAERTVISRELARELALSDDGEATLHSMSGTESVSTVLVPSLRVSESAVSNVRAPALSQLHLGASGLIGIDSLRDQRITLDFKAGKMTITPGQRGGGGVSRNNDEIVVTARSRFGQLVLVGATVNGRKVDVVVDTGSQVSVGNYALRSMMVSRNKKARPIQIIGVTGIRIEGDYGFAREIKLGGATIRNMPIAFADAPIFHTLKLNKRPAMMLGMDALQMFDRVSVDFASKKVKLMLPDGAERTPLTRMAVREPSASPAL
jgi:predicted aspartyl protease